MPEGELALGGGTRPENTEKAGSSLAEVKSFSHGPGGRQSFIFVHIKRLTSYLLMRASCCSHL